MKTREQKQQDLETLTAQFKEATAAMLVGFQGMTVSKDYDLRKQLREVGVEYSVVKNTLARRAVAGTPFEQASEHFKGVTGIAWTETDAVILSKAVSKFVKDNADIYTFKAGIVEGRVVNLKQVEAIASLPSKEELISKLMFVINAQAQRIVTVINAVPRNLAIVIKQIGDQKTDAPAAEQKAETVTEQAEAVPEAAAVSEQDGVVPEDAAAVATEQNEEPMAATDAPEAEKSE